VATLIVTPFTPREGSGRGLRTIAVARALARLDEVEIAYVEFDGSQPAASLAAEGTISLRRLQATRGLPRLAAYARARVCGTPRPFARGVSRELVGAVGRETSFSRVVADGPTAAAALILVAQHPRVVYNAHNLESQLRPALSSGAREYGGTVRLSAFERELMTRALETWMPTQREVAAASTLAPGGAFRYVPNVIDVRAIHPVAPNIKSGRILFVADFSYEPNRNAARFLLDEVMPRLWRTLPTARLALAGRSLELAATDERVEVLGFVDRLELEYAASASAVVPLRESGGSPLKFIEAMAYGIPVVATQAAAAGLDAAVEGVHFLGADSADAFAEALAAVFSGEGEDVGRNGRMLVEAEYSMEALVECLRDRRQPSLT
jgi:glycosyltransferase involved in cell wall biosynthesis